MLQKTKMVSKARAVIESLYDGTCDIVEHQKVKNTNKSTGFKDVAVHEDIPCRLSFKTINSTNQLSNAASAVTQVTTLFINPDIKITPGSKIVVTQNNVTTDYKQSGEPAMYSTHQELTLELFKEWA